MSYVPPLEKVRGSKLYSPLRKRGAREDSQTTHATNSSFISSINRSILSPKS